jgi:hypothetical protein
MTGESYAQDVWFVVLCALSFFRCPFEQPMVNLGAFLPIFSCKWPEFEKLVQDKWWLLNVAFQNFRKGRAVGLPESLFVVMSYFS